MNYFIIFQILFLFFNLLQIQSQDVILLLDGTCDYHNRTMDEYTDFNIYSGEHNGILTVKPNVNGIFDHLIHMEKKEQDNFNIPMYWFADSTIRGLWESRWNCWPNIHYPRKHGFFINNSISYYYLTNEHLMKQLYPTEQKKIISDSAHTAVKRSGRKIENCIFTYYLHFRKLVDNLKIRDKWEEAFNKVMYYTLKDLSYCENIYITDQLYTKIMFTDPIEKKFILNLQEKYKELAELHDNIKYINFFEQTINPMLTPDLYYDLIHLYDNSHNIWRIGDAINVFLWDSFIDFMRTNYNITNVSR